jgi:hypothetical protein
MTKTLLAVAAILAALSIPTLAAAPSIDGLSDTKVQLDNSNLETKRRKRRIPGGSGCDDPGDILEHPECTPPKAAGFEDLNLQDLMQEAKRKRRHGGRARVPGGSGCDDPGDILEHPECNPNPPA